MNSYEEKQEAKRERLLAAADAADEKASQAYDRADLSEGKTGIPFGQPILIGHHSERRHRKTIERADNAMRQSVEASKRAGDLRSRAASVGSGGISSDDPEAVTKLKAKIEKLEQKQAMMKASNRIIRAHVKKGITFESSSEDLEPIIEQLNHALEMTLKEQTVRNMFEPDCFGGIGFASYQLTNNNAKVKQAKKRLKSLEFASQRKTVKIEIEGICELVENVEENRIQFLFDGKPSAEIRTILKSHAFKWSPMNKAWQRQLNNNGIYSAKLALKKIQDLSV